MTQKVVERATPQNLRKLLKEYANPNIFLVTGKDSYQDSGAQAFIQDSIKGFSVTRFFEFEKNPKYEDALRGTELLSNSNCNIIIAIGGGSVMDMAKLINAFSSNTGLKSLDIVLGHKKISKRGLPLIAIPTTAGSGSEATHFAVVYYDKVKFSVASDFMLPDIVLLNSEFTFNQPKYLAACSGLDALSQAIESYWSVGATTTSKKYAEKAIGLLLASLQKAINHQDRESKEKVIQGAHLAGKAINISKTTAAHALSYAFTTFYKVPHGHAVFLTLPEFLEYNYGVSAKDNNHKLGFQEVKRNLESLCAIMNVDSPREGAKFLKAFAAELDVELSLKELGIFDFQTKISENVNMERLGNNPRKISKEKLLVMLDKKG